MAERGFHDRLLLLVNELGGQNAFARRVGMSQSSVNRMLSGGGATLTTLLSISKATGKTVEWLATGSGAELERSEPEMVHIPLLNIEAAAGVGAENGDEHVIDRIPVPLAFAKSWGRPLSKVEALHVKGDSMEPTIQNGAYVFIDRSEQNPIEGRIYAFLTADGLKLKRLQSGMDGSTLLVSDNHAVYQPERFSLGDLAALKVIGRVFWTGKLL